MFIRAALVAAFTLAASSALAQNAMGAANPCAADAKAMCATQLASGDRAAVRACLKDNAAKVSPECKARMQQAANSPCAQDMKTYCATEMASKDRAAVRTCMQANASKASPACQAQMAKWKSGAN
jgi:hypothetical protein